MMFRIRNWGIALILLSVGSGMVSMTPSLNAILTPTPLPVYSLFEGDTCTPPCWFGLIPGESTSQELVEFLKTRPEVIEWHDEIISTPNTDLVEGGYTFQWLNGYESVFIVRNNVLSWMGIVMNRLVTLREALDKLGEPQEVRLTASIDYRLSLFYPQLNMIVNLSASSNACQMSNILEDYTVEYLYYYAPSRLSELEKERNLDQWITIPDETWSMWLEGKPEGTCGEAIGQVVRMSDPATMTTVPLATSSPLILTPMPVASLFAEDTCSPPCWFGLTPGQSTTEDVIAMFQSSSDLFGFHDSQDFTTLTDDSNTSFFWRKYATITNSRPSYENYLEIHEGKLDFMRIAMNDTITLGQTLEMLGEPVDISVSGGLSEIFLTLIYSNLQTIVILRNELPEADISNIRNDFSVIYVLYYSSHGFEKLNTTGELYRYYVLDDIWDTWLSGSLNGLTYGKVIGNFLIEADAATQAAPTTTPTAKP